jgi:hypothetical protein
VRWISSCSRRSQRRSSCRTFASLDGERARQCDALALAAGQLSRVAVAEVVELHEPQQLVDLGVDGLVRRTGGARPHAQAEGDVLEHRHVPEERVVLEDEADASLARVAIGGVLVLEDDRAAIGALEPRDDAQERRLARARRPEQRDELAGIDGKADVVDRGETAEGLGDVANLDTHRPKPTP